MLSQNRKLSKNIIDIRRKNIITFYAGFMTENIAGLITLLLRSKYVWIINNKSDADCVVAGVSLFLY